MFQTFWLLLAYSYNIVLVLFIAIHLFVGAIISFLVGLYIGVYLTQNYEIPRINDPRTLREKFLGFLERNRRDPQKITMSNILRPTTVKELILEEQSSSKQSETLETASATTTLLEQLQTKKETGDIDHESFGDQDVEEHEVDKVSENDTNDTEELETEFLASRMPSINTTLILSDNELEEYERELEATSLADNFRDTSPLRTLRSEHR